jgi:hypothetical protein
MKRLGPHVIVEKVSPLKRTVCHRKRLTREAVKGTLLDQKSARKSNLNRKKSTGYLENKFWLVMVLGVNGLREWKGPRVASRDPSVTKTVTAQSERSACGGKVRTRSVLGQKSSKSQSK